jgi:hypothetical protein
MTDQYTAICNTVLKKAPVQSSTLAEDQKVDVPEGKTYGIKKLIETDGLHGHVKLESGAGSWWIFLPHWDTGEAKRVITPSTTGIVTAVFTLNQARSSQLKYDLLDKEVGCDSVGKYADMGYNWIYVED